MTDTTSGATGPLGVEPVRRRSPRTTRRRDPSAMAIGEHDANIFGCPVCGRPLGVGTRRCPGCRARLVSGVQLPKVIGFIATGLVAGLMAGSLAMTAAFTIPAMLAPATTGAGAGAVPSAAPGASSAPASLAPVPVDAGIPSAALNSLRQSAILNQRLVADAAALSTAVTAKKPNAIEIARALRALSANAAAGDRMALGLAAWSEGGQLSTDLAAFYTALGGAAREGLAASLNNTKAYVNAGKATIKVMAGLPDLHASARYLASLAEIEIAEVYPD